MIEGTAEKSELLQIIINKLELVLQGAVASAQRAYDTATDEENEAENKYDTLGLEASYLAHGQSKRVAECEADLIKFKKLELIQFEKNMIIKLGALVRIEDENGHEKNVFLSPVAGGLKVVFNKQEITLVTLTSPLGTSLLKHVIGDDVVVKIAGQSKQYFITDVF